MTKKKSLTNSCKYDTTFNALRLTGWDAANGARALQKPSHWRLNPCDFKDPDSSGSTRAWRTDQTCAATQRRTGLNHHSQYLGTGSLRETTRLQGQVTSPYLRSKVYAVRVKTCAQRTTPHLHPCCALRTSLRASARTARKKHNIN